MDTKQQKHEIQAWLDSQKDYQAGLILLLKYSKNKALKNFLARKQNSKKLAYELAKLAKTRVGARHALPKTPKTSPKTQEPGQEPGQLPNITERIKISENGEVKLEDLPEELQKYWQENSVAYKLQRALHEKLKLSTNEPELAELYKKITDLDNQISENWKIIDTYVTTGEFIEKTKTTPTDNKLTPQEVNALRTKISRYIATLEKNRKIPENKKNELIEKTQAAVNKLTADNQQLAQETVDKLSNFNISINNTQENA